MTIKAIVFDAYGTLYDIQSVASVTEEAFPGYGNLITQIWRMKQLEYTWLRSMMSRYEDFSVVTKDSLTFTLNLLGLKYDGTVLERILDKYVHLDLYPDALATLEILKTHKLAILSNGSSFALNALVKNTSLTKILNAVISVDSVKIFKPSPLTYSLIEARLGVKPEDVLFVSSNPFDVCGAKSFGLHVAWIERVNADVLASELKTNELITPLNMFKALRTQMDHLGYECDFRLQALSNLPDIIGRLN